MEKNIMFHVYWINIVNTKFRFEFSSLDCRSSAKIVHKTFQFRDVKWNGVLLWLRENVICLFISADEFHLKSLKQL